MNIHIFGHSSCHSGIRQNRAPTFTDILAEKYSIPSENIVATTNGSEERILYLLKKAKNVDLVIIFHSNIGSNFVPTLSRDFSPHTPEKRHWIFQEEAFKSFTYIKNPDLSNQEKLPVDYKEFELAYDLYMKYFHTTDLSKNRYYGTLIQIDQYITAKKIPAIHCILPNQLPSWFKFTSGIVDTELSEPCFGKGEYAGSYQLDNNGITLAGNRYIAAKLSEYIEQLKS
jgi:hypothetical protein